MKFHPFNLGLFRSLLALSVSLAVVLSSHAFAFASFSSFNRQPQIQPLQGEAGLLSASAVVTEAGVRLEWQNNFDPDNIGFNVYRLRGGNRTRINRMIIPGAVFSAGRNAQNDSQNLLARGGQSYAWFDPAGTRDSVYYIESVNLDGVSRLHEPLTAAPENQAPGPKRIRPISETNTQNSEIVSADENDGKGAYQTMYPGGPPAAAATRMSASTIEDQWAIAGQTGLKISIKKDGWYRVTQPQMAAAGFNPTVDITNLQLFVDGLEVAISTSQSGGPFGPADYVEFFGRGLDVPTSDVRTYYLIAGASPGKRVRGEMQIDSPWSPSPTPQPSPSPSPSPAGSPAPKPVKPKWSAWGWRRLVISKGFPVGMPVIPMIVWPGEQSVSTPVITPLASPDDSPKVATKPEPAASEIVATPAITKSGIESQQKSSRPNARKQRKKKRLRQQKAEPRREFSHAVSTAAAAVAPSNFEYTVERKDRGVYFSSLLNGDEENWFGAVIAGSPVSLTLTIPNPDLSALGPARLEFALQGVMNQIGSRHVVNVAFNGTTIATLDFAALEHPVQSVSVPVGQVLSGDNTVTFTKTSTGEVCIVDYVRLTYPHAFQADAGALKFILRGTQTRQVDGFSTPLMRLIDYTDPLAVSTTKPTSEPSALGYAITVPLGASRSKAQRLLYAIPAGQFDQPAALTLNQPSSLNLNSNAADFLIVAHQTLIPSLTTNALPINTSLVAQRQSQGMTVKVVDVADVFDEFGYGLHGPQAIRDFLNRAATTWATKPKYVIFAGDATFDPRNYVNAGNFDMVPSKLIDATYNETVSDDWLADFDDDGIADIPMGRLPLRTAAEADLVISKIVNYTPGNVPHAALLVADDPGTPPSWDFELSSDNVATLLPPSMTVEKSYRRLEVKVLTGTVSTNSGSTTVTGTGTLFLTPAEIQVGTVIARNTGERLGIVASISSDTSLTLQVNAASTYAGGYGKPDNATATAHIIDAINQGKAIVNYSGHGNVNVWTGANIFNNAHATALTNGNKLPFVVVMDCLNGYYHDPNLLSLSEAFLKAPGGGAVAVFASSGLTTTFGQRQMELQLYTSLYTGQPLALGDAIKIAKGASIDIDVRRTWIFFGDPSMKIR